MLNCIIYMDILIKFIDFRIAAINKCILLLSYHSWIDILSIVASSTNGTYRTEEYIIIYSMLACSVSSAPVPQDLCLCVFTWE